MTHIARYIDPFFVLVQFAPNEDLCIDLVHKT